jgi:undecaprenyl-diphosphatase
MKVVVAAQPAVVVQGLLEHLLRENVGAPKLAAGFLIANGVMLFVADRLRTRAHGGVPLDSLRWRDALIIGVWQCLALLPGLSRSGAAMAGGYLSGLDHQDAAKFSFLTAAPIILGATVLEAPRLLKHGWAHGAFSGIALASGVVAGIAAFVSTAAIMRWFRGHEARGFDPFAIYCATAGAGALAWLGLHG